MFGGSFAPVKTNAKWTSMFSSVACVRPEARLTCKTQARLTLAVLRCLPCLLACSLTLIGCACVARARRARVISCACVARACRPGVLSLCSASSTTLLGLSRDLISVSGKLTERDLVTHLREAIDEMHVRGVAARMTAPLTAQWSLTGLVR